MGRVVGALPDTIGLGAEENFLFHSGGEGGGGGAERGELTQPGALSDAERNFGGAKARLSTETMQRMHKFHSLNLRKERVVQDRVLDTMLRAFAVRGGAEVGFGVYFGLSS